MGEYGLILFVMSMLLLLILGAIFGGAYCADEMLVKEVERLSDELKDLKLANIRKELKAPQLESGLAFITRVQDSQIVRLREDGDYWKDRAEQLEDQLRNWKQEVERINEECCQLKKDRQQLKNGQMIFDYKEARADVEKLKERNNTQAQHIRKLLQRNDELNARVQFNKVVKHYDDEYVKAFEMVIEFLQLTYVKEIVNTLFERGEILLNGKKLTLNRKSED